MRKFASRVLERWAAGWSDALASAVTAAMAAMSVATIVWWFAIADAAPAFLGGGLLVPRLLLPVLAMLVATVLGGLGTTGAARARAQARKR